MAAPSEIIIDYDDVDYKQETKDFMRNLPRYTKDYIVGLFPILHWIHRYNLVVKYLNVIIVSSFGYTNVVVL